MGENVGLKINQANSGAGIKETKLSGIMKRIKGKQGERMRKGDESETARTKHLSLCVCLLCVIISACLTRLLDMKTHMDIETKDI